ncbi:MAG TPA: NAD+ synthase [Candidatus Cloacimonadota bacterium]|jgi:NAD+ synthase|nr:NAD+ synthase [Candidatus Cloacimonadota bacterium]HOF59376.1 NAD+ synthase [Candidatus Cloacimonadota bacterium]HOR58526.1 NAD+ synthase [Candidatus Cloacimonadota bacterium]HQL13007.1 NAD+ synthase [Candidatus Cloacimonadota bacterium]HQO44045.1 NAD+ synthase [Candidatus Cloacimonadota bacterium]
MRKIDWPAEIDRITDFIRGYLANSGWHKLILGLSGGVDSAVAAALAAKAIGKENVIAVMMPYKNSHPDSLDDAVTLAKQLGIEYQVRNITAMTDAYFDTFEPSATALRRGNWMARTRMCVLFDLSSKLQALVLGTSNKTELMVGYFTQFGDSACALEPIGHLYKTEVWQLARLLDIPEAIVNKVPSADLWEGQSDEADLGMRYQELDEILYELLESDIDVKASARLSHPRELYDKVERMISRSAFKRNMPPILMS